MSFVDVNGKPIDMKALQERQLEHRRRLYLEGKRSPRKPTAKNGYAAPPGTGPDGKTCRDCEHKKTMGNYGGKHYIKCDLRRATWTNGEGTDILARSPACSKFTERTKEQP